MFIENLATDQRFFLAVVITVVVSICVHELAHGAAALWLGDRTPVESGHMTLNPAVHMGGFSVVMLLLAGIAWGSMPINPARMKGRFAEAAVAFAGPLSNVLLAVAALTGLGLWQRYGDGGEPGVRAENFRYLLWVFGYVNFSLALFNMIPLPPLDGSRIVSNFSKSYAAMMESIQANGTSLVLFLLVFAFAGKVTFPLAGKMALFTLQAVRGF